MEEKKPGNGGAPQKKSGGALKWVAVGCLVALLLVGGCVASFVVFVKGVGAGLYKDAVTAMQKQTVVVEKLGEPLKFGSVDSVNIQNDAGTVVFPVTGPKGSGTVTVTGRKVGSEWRIESMTVTVDSTKEVITVIGPEAPAPNKKK